MSLCKIGQKIQFLLILTKNNTTMKSLLTKLFAIIFIAILTVGCASSLTAPVQNVEKVQIQQQDAPQPGDTARGEFSGQTSKARPDL